MKIYTCTLNPLCKTLSAQFSPLRSNPLASRRRKQKAPEMAGRFKELMKKYGKVALGVHFSVSAASIGGLYVAINNNVDVESMLEKVGLSNLVKGKEEKPQASSSEVASTTDALRGSEEFAGINQGQAPVKQRNRTADLVKSSGGALTLAFLLNKALFPLRVPVTIALTPPIARFLARRQLIKNSL